MTKIGVFRWAMRRFEKVKVSFCYLRSSNMWVDALQNTKKEVTPIKRDFNISDDCTLVGRCQEKRIFQIILIGITNTTYLYMSASLLLMIANVEVLP